MDLPRIWTVELSKQDPLPGSKPESAILDRNREAVSDDQCTQVRVGILSRATSKEWVIVLIVDSTGYELLKERRHI
jgi:hypothetical protein